MCQCRSAFPSPFLFAFLLRLLSAFLLAFILTCHCEPFTPPFRPSLALAILAFLQPSCFPSYHPSSQASHWPSWWPPSLLISQTVCCHPQACTFISCKLRLLLNFPWQVWFQSPCCVMLMTAQHLAPWSSTSHSC